MHANCLGEFRFISLNCTIYIYTTLHFIQVFLCPVSFLSTTSTNLMIRPVSVLSLLCIQWRESNLSHSVATSTRLDSTRLGGRGTEIVGPPHPIENIFLVPVRYRPRYQKFQNLPCCCSVSTFVISRYAVAADHDLDIVCN